MGGSCTSASKVRGDDKYKLLTSTVEPPSIGWVVGCNADGRLNCAPFSFFSLLGQSTRNLHRRGGPSVGAKGHGRKHPAHG